MMYSRTYIIGNYNPSGQDYSPSFSQVYVILEALTIRLTFNSNFESKFNINYPDVIYDRHAISFVDIFQLNY